MEAFQNNDTFLVMWPIQSKVDDVVLRLFWLLSSLMSLLKIKVNLYILQIAFLQIAATDGK